VYEKGITMIHFLHVFIIALTNNLDNIGVRIAYTIRGIKISIVINIWISLITFVISYFAAYSGTVISGYIGKQLSSLLTMILLSGIGSYMIYRQYLKRMCRGEFGQDNKKGICHILLKPENADIDNSKHIDFKEATLLGIALSVNNVGGGVSAGMIGLNPFWVGLLSAMLSFFILWAGNYMAEFFIKWNLSNKATVAAGIMLIAIGIEQVIF
jgi:putative sporulation protein YtaF